MRLPIPILILISFIGCKDSTIRSDCDFIEEMMERDQLYRGDISISATFYVADSLARMKYGNRMVEDDIGEFLADAHNITKDRPDSDFIDVKRRDSLWKLQNEIDYKNTIDLIKIFDHIPTTSLDSLGCYNVVLLPFIHAPESLFPEVRRVIEEHKKFIGFNRYRHIRWHLDGRNAYISEEDFYSSKE